MGRSVPSYTRLLEETIDEISELGSELGEEYQGIVKRIIKLSRELQGPLYLHTLTDVRFLIVIRCLIDIYKRLERLEKWISKDGY